jgi:hypothetical protein
VLLAFFSTHKEPQSIQTSRAFTLTSLAVLGCVAIILGLSFFVPKRDLPHCVHIVPLGSTATIQHNCDSLLIAQTADDPDAYLTEVSMWRTRPAHILFVAAAGRILKPFTSGLTDGIEARVPDLERYIPNARGLLHYYYAGILFNALVVALAYAAAIWTLPALSPLGRLGIAGAIASFDITLAWFWVPHQIILNILMPMGGVIAFLVGVQVRRLTRQQIGVVGAITALFTLAYPNALIWPVTFCLGSVYGWLNWAVLGARETIIRLALYAAALCFVMLVWYLPYLLMFDETISHEANLGQFGWLPEAVRDGEVLSAIALQMEIFAGSVAIYAGPYGLALLLVLFAALFALARVHSSSALRDPVLLASGATMIAMMLFNFFHGYHPGRLLLFPLLLLVIATSRALLLIGFDRTAAVYLLAVTATQIALAFARPALSQE